MDEGLTRLTITITADWTQFSDVERAFADCDVDGVQVRETDAYDSQSSSDWLHVLVVSISSAAGLRYASKVLVELLHSRRVTVKLEKDGVTVRYEGPLGNQEMLSLVSKLAPGEPPARVEP